MAYATQRNGYNYGAPQTVAVGSSPQVFQNPEAFRIRFMVDGALTKMEFSADNVTWYPYALAATLAVLNPLEYVRITWLIAPNSLTYIPF